MMPGTHGEDWNSPKAMSHGGSIVSGEPSQLKHRDFCLFARQNSERQKASCLLGYHEAILTADGVVQTT